MKKAISLIVTMTLVAVLVLLGTVVAYAASTEVTLEEGDSLSAALVEVADGGTIVVKGTVAVTTTLGTHGKTVTITGDTLDFSSLTYVALGDHITFDDITLKFAENTTLAPAVYANGYKVTMGEGVNMPNPIRIFGGKSGGAVASTHLTLLAGNYTEIYGGSNKGNIVGDTYLYVGGSVNDTLEISHSHTYCIHGGCYTAEGSAVAIGGTAYTEVAGNAKANYVYGGHFNSGTIAGGADVKISGGSLMSVYGGSRSGSLTGDIKVLISNGTMEQVFGGSEKNSVTGDVAVDITGGTIKRRVYGGCYNDYSWGWGSEYYVNGKIVLTLHSGANITFSSSESDRSLYAHSRQSNLSDAEESHLVYVSGAVRDESEEKAQDYYMKSVMSGVTVADYVHQHTYTGSGAVITQNCTDETCSASATLEIVGTPVYAGTAVEPAKVIYSGSWFGGDLEVAYADNTGVGTGTASITCGGAAASREFTIAAPKLIMNGVGYLTLEEALVAARKTSGTDTITLQEDMEISSGLVVDTAVTITADKAVTITAADSQVGGLIRIIDGTFTVKGKSEAAKITLEAGKSTTHIISNNGGKVVLTNVRLTGDKNTNNKVCGIFNYKGTTTATSAEIADMGSDGIYVMKDTTVNLDNVTVSGSGRYGIKVKGRLNIANAVHKDHALSVSGSADHAIDVENGGKVVCNLEDVPADTYVINLVDNARKGLHVRKGGDAELLYVNEEA